MNKLILNVMALLSILLIWQGASADEQQVVEKVEIIGNEVVPKSTILYYLSEKPGKVFSRKLAAEDIKTLFKLGYFENISVDVKEGKNGVILRYFVKEKPIITDVVFKGNKSLSSKKLKEELGLINEEEEESKLQEPLSYKYLDTLKKKIREIYERKGYPGTRVYYTIERISPTRAVATFVIDE